MPLGLCFAISMISNKLSAHPVQGTLINLSRLISEEKYENITDHILLRQPCSPSCAFL